MLDQVLDQLKTQAAPTLMKQLGLDQQQAHGSVQAAGESVKEVLARGHGFGADTLLNLFSTSQNTGAAENLLSTIGRSFSSKLTDQVGLNAAQAGGVKNMILPMLTQLLSDKVGGNANNLQGLLGGISGDHMAEAAKGFLGKLFK